jgi:methylglutaconyl-CoA hydratase
VNVAVETVVVSEGASGRVTVTLNRPELHNAFDDALILRLTETFDALAKRKDLRVIVLTGAGRSFSAGGDLNWMRRMASYSEAENRADAGRLAGLLHRLDTMPQPTVARVNGAALAGGMGLVSCCDAAIAADGAVFGLSEVRIGLVPATIGPYVIAAMGARAARRYMLTGERFGAVEALRVGLVHRVVAADALDAAVEEAASGLALGGPTALAETKALVASLGGLATEKVRGETAALIARVRASAEGKEGVSAFLEKRKPAWQTS